MVWAVKAKRVQRLGETIAEAQIYMDRKDNF